MQKFWLLLAIPAMLLLAACGSNVATPTLGAPGQATLVFVYTEN